MRVIRSHENNRRRNVFRLEPLECRKPVELRHHDVEKENVGPVLDYRLARLVSVRTLGNYFYRGNFIEQVSQTLSRERLIVYQYCFKRHKELLIDRSFRHLRVRESRACRCSRTSATNGSECWRCRARY